MKVVIREVDGTHRTVLTNDAGMYQTLKDSVGGWLGHVVLTFNGVNVDVWLDDEGKLKELPINLTVPHDVLVGPLVFTGGADREGRTMGLNAQQEEVIRALGEGEEVIIDWPY